MLILYLLTVAALPNHHEHRLSRILTTCRDSDSCCRKLFRPYFVNMARGFTSFVLPVESIEARYDPVIQNAALYSCQDTRPESMIEQRDQLRRRGRFRLRCPKLTRLQIQDAPSSRFGWEDLYVSKATCVNIGRKRVRDWIDSEESSGSRAVTWASMVAIESSE